VDPTLDTVYINTEENLIRWAKVGSTLKRLETWIMKRFDSGYPLPAPSRSHWFNWDFSIVTEGLMQSTETGALSRLLSGSSLSTDAQ
jgi:hypothetical protein